MSGESMANRRRKYHNLDELASKESVRRWRESLAGSGQKHALYAVNRYVLWRRRKGLPDDPDQWVAECMNGNNATLIQHLKVLQDYVASDEFEGDDRETRRKQYFRMRGLYERNFVPLPDVRLKLPNGDNHDVKVEITASQFLAMVKRVLAVGNVRVRDKSIILTMLQGGMDDSTLAEVFNFVAFPQLVAFFGTADFEKWDSAKCPVRIDLTRPKSTQRFYTFIDVDGIDMLKEWLRVRRRKYGEIQVEVAPSPDVLPCSDAVYLDLFGRGIKPDGVGTVFRNCGKRAGANVHSGPMPARYKGARVRYPFHSHEVRDTLRTLARGRADVEAAEFFVGHPLDKLGYDKSPWNDPDYFRQEYMKIARPLLNPLGGTVQEVKEDMERKTQVDFRSLQSQVAEMRKRLEEMLEGRTA
jgi:hypothetical protein